MSETLQELYKELPKYPWPKVKTSGKWRCRVKRVVRTTEISQRLAQFIPPGMSMAKFAKRIGTAGTGVADMLQKNHAPRYEALCKYAKNLGIEPEELIGSVTEKEVETIEDFWLFKDDQVRKVTECIEPLKLVEEYRPLDLRKVDDKLVAGLVEGVAIQANSDIDDWKQRTNEAGSRIFFEELFSEHWAEEDPEVEARKEVAELYPKTTKEAKEAQLYLDRLWNTLTGNDGKTRPNRIN